MTIRISADDPRSIEAIEIVAGASQWLKCRTVDGALAFGIPSQCKQANGRHYIVDGQRCDCEDFKRNVLSPDRRGEEGNHGPCKNILAVRPYCELQTAMHMRTQPRRRRAHLALLPSPVAELAARYDDIFSKFEGTKTMASSRQELIEEIAEDLTAERRYADMLAHRETVVDAFHPFDATCALGDDHSGPCSPIDPNPGQPILGSVGPVRCGQPVEAFDHCDRRRHYARCADTPSRAGTCAGTPTRATTTQLSVPRQRDGRRGGAGLRA